MLGLPILDTASAICRRVSAHRHIFEADGEHTHHRLMRAGLSHRGAVLVLYALQAVFVLLGVAVMAGAFAAFGVALALAVVASMAISALSRRARVPVAEGTASTVSLRAVPSPLDTRAPVRVARRRNAEVEVLAELPPAAAGGGPS
jgi:UDP-GlcNAc:undecaprenyl-phosphate GlcNAc-1-phosphate transferase